MRLLTVEAGIAIAGLLNTTEIEDLLMPTIRAVMQVKCIRLQVIFVKL